MAPAKSGDAGPSKKQEAPVPSAESLTLLHLSTHELQTLVKARGIKTQSIDRAELMRLLTTSIKKELPRESLWVAAPGESRRRGASCVTYKNAVYQFGGVDIEGTVYNTVHKWSEAEGWLLMETRGIPPAPRWTHTAVEYQGGMYVFGGFYGFGGQGPTGRYNDLHRLDLERMTWTKVTVNGRPPSVRSHHTAIVLRDKMYIFGGADEERIEDPADNFGTQLLKTLNVAEAQYRDVMHNDLHEFNFLTCSWRVVDVSDLSPTAPPEGGITARLAVHDELLYVMGWRPAREGDSPGAVVEGQVLEMHVLDVQSRHSGRHEGLPAWQLVHFRGNAPQPRDLFACAVWKDSWILHGGRSARGDLLRDTFVFSFKTRAWKLLLAKCRGQNVPDHRYSHQAAVLDDVFLVVGGSNSAQYVGGANRNLAQRCSGVEMLYLARVVEAPPEYVPPVEKKAPVKRNEPVWRSNFHRFWWELWMFIRAYLPGGGDEDAAARQGASGLGQSVSDVDLLVEGRRFHAHSRVLDRQSERFAQILARDPLETAADRAFAPALRLQEYVNKLGVPSLVVFVYYLLIVWKALVTIILAGKMQLFPNRSRLIVIRDVSYDTMLIMMHFIYAGLEDRPSIPSAKLEEAFLAAERYGVYAMRAESLKLMIKGLAVNNVSQYALLAHENACQELWDACVEFCADRLPEIVSSEGFALLWSINARVAQMLTGDAARELHLVSHAKPGWRSRNQPQHADHTQLGGSGQPEAGPSGRAGDGAGPSGTSGKQVGGFAPPAAAAQQQASGMGGPPPVFAEILDWVSAPFKGGQAPPPPQPNVARVVEPTRASK